MAASTAGAELTCTVLLTSKSLRRAFVIYYAHASLQAKIASSSFASLGRRFGFGQRRVPLLTLLLQSCALFILYVKGSPAAHAGVLQILSINSVV